MILACITLARLLSVILSDDPTFPAGVYTPRNWTTSDMSVDLTFLDDRTVRYKINHPMGYTWSPLSYPVSMVSSSVVSVRVPQSQLQHYKRFAPGAFEDLGLQVFFYDPMKNRITVNGIARTFQILHSSDPARDPGPVSDVRKPSGVYQGTVANVHVGMQFANGRVRYRLTIANILFSFSLGYEFQMMSSSLIRVWLPHAQLQALHNALPGWQEDYFYMNLGYDPRKDEITFVLKNWYRVILTRTSA
ncbi:hypothetical protein FOL47_002845, partial [Perkinsus chesapeaki]